MAVAAVVAVAAGVSAGIAASSLIVGIAVAVSAFAMSQMAKAQAPGAARSNTERKQVLRSSRAATTFVVGKTVASGVLFFAEEQPGNQDFDDGEALYLAIGLAGHPLARVGQVWLDDDSINTFGDKAEYEIHAGRTTPDPYMLEHAPSWKDDMIGRGVTWARVTLRYDQDAFPSGIPTPRFEKYGVKVLDPRDNVTRWTQNAALIILWYYRERLGVPEDEILWDSFKDAANLCDEPVTNPDGSQEARYTINGEFDADERPDRVLEDMHRACAGEPLRIGGKIGLVVGAYYGPGEFTITESMIIGDVSIQPEVSRAEAVNAVYGTFADPEQRYSETDYPPVRVNEWIEEDGEEIKDDLDLRFVASPYQAQRIANIHLRRKRSGARVELPMNLVGYGVRPGMVVRLDLPLIGLEGEFRCTKWDFHGSQGAKISLARESIAIYDDAIGKPYTTPPLINVPVGGPGSPTGLQFVLEAIGEVVQGTIVWQASGTPAYHNVIVRRGTKAIITAQVPGTQINVSGLTAGSYTAEVRAVDAFGIRSGAATLVFTIERPPMPDLVETEVGNWYATLRPRLVSGTRGGVSWEFWYSTKDLALGQVEAQAKLLTTGASLEHQGLQAGTTFYYWVRGVNAYGKSAFYRVVVKTTADSSEVINLISGEINASMLTKDFLQYLEGMGDQWSVRVDQHGRVAGIGAYNDGKRADFIIVADNFWIADPDDVAGKTKPFIVSNGNVYINQAFIHEVVVGKIVSSTGEAIFTGNRIKAKFVEAERLSVKEAADISGTIRSTVKDSQGRPAWVIYKNGGMEINGEGTGGRMRITRNRIDVHDSSGVLRVRIGQL